MKWGLLCFHDWILIDEDVTLLSVPRIAPQLYPGPTVKVPSGYPLLNKRRLNLDPSQWRGSLRPAWQHIGSRLRVRAHLCQAFNSPKILIDGPRS